ncbi:MAG: tyrosine recombinase XerC [Negativicutes bacterium]
MKDKLAFGVSHTTPSLSEWLDAWLKDIVALDKKPSTYTNYKTIAEMHLKPDLWRILLDKLTQSDVQRLISKKARTNLAARTVRLIRRVLHCALNRAVNLKMIALNPASDLILPRIENAAIATVSPAQVFQLQSSNCLRQSLCFPCILLMGYTGDAARPSGGPLRRPDIDLNRGTVTVQREIVKAAGGTVYQSPKTKRSSRFVPFGDTLKAILLAHKQRQADFNLWPKLVHFIWPFLAQFILPRTVTPASA